MSKKTLTELEYRILSLTLGEKSGPDLALAVEAGLGHELILASFYSALRRLEGAKLIKSRPNGENRRIRDYKITANGVKAFEKRRESFRKLGELGLEGAR